MIDLQKAREDLRDANKPNGEYWEHTRKVIKTHMPAALDEIARLREALVEERAMKLMTEHNGTSSPIKDMVDFLGEARQQLGAERKI